MSTWEERMAARHARPVKAGNPRSADPGEAIRWATANLDGYDPAQYEWSEKPPADDECHCCDEWRQYPPGQRHFGWAWWRISERQRECDHRHHLDEVWLA